MIDEFNSTSSNSVTGSISYYFMEMSAIELSYTKGVSRLSARVSESEPQLIYRTDFELMGADLVITFASRQSMLQPFVKVGAAQVKKTIQLESSVGSTNNAAPDPETVPSAGIGFKLKLTKTFAIKAGVDAWLTNQGEDDETIDYAGRAGISWMF